MLLQVVGQFQGGDDPVLKIYGSQLANISAEQKAFLVTTKLDADLKSGDIDVSELSLSALGVNISGNLSVRNMQSENGNVDGKLLVEGKTWQRYLLHLIMVLRQKF